MRTLLRGTHPLEVCREVIARALHPEEVDVDTGDRIRPLVLDDRHHLLTWIRLYSRCLAARNLFLAGAIDRCRWEIGAALVAAADSPCYLDEVYLAELRDLLRTADDALLAGETTIQHHGPYVDLTMAENLCVTRMIRREARRVRTWLGHADVAFTMRTLVHSPPDALGEAAQSLAQVVTIRDNSRAAGVARAPKRSATASRTAALTVERAKVARREVPDRNYRAR